MFSNYLTIISFRARTYFSFLFFLFFIFPPFFLFFSFFFLPPSPPLSMLTGMFRRKWRAQNTGKDQYIKCDVSSFSFPQRTDNNFMHCKKNSCGGGKWYCTFFLKLFYLWWWEEELRMGSIRYDDKSGNWEMKCQVEMWSGKCTLWMLHRLIN